MTTTDHGPALSADVVYAANMKPGDLYAGRYVPDAPTRKVQTFARAHKLTEVTTYTDDEGRHMVRPVASYGELTSVPAVTQCLVIRS